MPRRPIALLAVPALLALPGCIVQDIHDGIVEANSNLTSINDSFAKVETANELLTKVDGQLTTLDGRIEELNTKLDTLDSVNERLVRIDELLTETEVHLGSLRKTINNIDSTIPFLSLSGDDEEEKEALEEGDQEPGDGAADAEPGESDTGNSGGGN